MITTFENFKFYKKGLPVKYSAIVLDNKSHDILLSKFVYPNPDFNDWIKIAHHMTICLGELPEHIKKYWLDEEITLTVTELGISDKSVAVKVTGYFNIAKPSLPDDEISKFPHITLAINPINAKPADSNYITDWQEIEPFEVKGTVMEIS